MYCTFRPYSQSNQITPPTLPQCIGYPSWSWQRCWIRNKCHLSKKTAIHFHPLDFRTVLRPKRFPFHSKFISSLRDDRGVCDKRFSTYHFRDDFLIFFSFYWASLLYSIMASLAKSTFLLSPRESIAVIGSEAIGRVAVANIFPH